MTTEQFYLQINALLNHVQAWKTSKPWVENHIEHAPTTDISIKAAKYASAQHCKGPRRKYTGRPYIEHPARVATRVYHHPISNPDIVAAAWLHDVVEDCPVTIEEITKLFNPTVSKYVKELTNPSKSYSQLSRHERKKLDREHYKRVSHEAKIIKLIDRIDNLNEIPHDTNFTKELYAPESLLLLHTLKGTDKQLENELEQIIQRIL